VALLIALLCTIPAAVAGQCLPIKGEYIRASDLAPVIAAFAKVDPGQTLAPAPIGTAVRWLRRPELARWLNRYGHRDLVEADICVARPSRRITGEELKAVLAAALESEQAQIEIIDYSRYEVPEWKIEFRLSGLAGSAATRADQAVLWRGKLVSGGGRSFPVWARVRVSVEREVLVAARDITAGQRLSGEDLAIEKRYVFPLASNPPSRDGVAGRIALRSIAAGERIPSGKLARSRDVSPGDLVETETSSGSVRLRLTAMAETGGNVGDRIWLKPRQGGKRFPALLVAPGQAQITEAPK